LNPDHVVIKTEGRGRNNWTMVSAIRLYRSCNYGFTAQRSPYESRGNTIV
jgi:hypothetical protein